MYKRKIVFLSDRYTVFELNVLQHLSQKPSCIIRGQLTVKTLLDEGLIIVEKVLTEWHADDGSYIEIMDFVATLTEEGRRFLMEWSNDGDELTY